MAATAAHATTAPRPAPTSGGSLRALRTRDFRLLWLGQIASFSGSWMQAVAQACVVMTLTRSPLALGLLTVMQFAPALLLSLFGGVLADRLPKRRLVLALQTVLLGLTVALALLVTSGALELWHVYVLAALLGTTSALEIPARQALMPELVDAALLPNAVALNQTAGTLAQIVGPLAGGLLARGLGPAACYWINAASFAVMITGLLAMTSVKTVVAPAAARAGLKSELAAGLGHALRTPEVALALLLTGVLGTFGYIFSLVLPLVARDLLGADPSAAGALTATIGLGSLIAALVMARQERATPRMVLAGAGGFSLLLLATARLPGWGLTLPLLAGVGMCSALFLTSSMTLIQAATPAELRGRVMSIASLLSLGVKPLGALLIGTIAAKFGVQTALTVAALLCGAGTLAGVALLARHRLAMVMRRAPAGGQVRVAPAV